MIRLENVLKISFQDALKASSKRLEDVLKTLLQDVFKMFWRCFEDVLVRRLKGVLAKLFEDVLKMSWRRMAKTNILVLTKTFSEDVWLRWICSSWSRRLQEVLKTFTEDGDERRHIVQNPVEHQQWSCFAKNVNGSLAVNYFHKRTPS